MTLITVSVIICTRDHAESLRLTLESVRQTKVPLAYSVELVVVDNGSGEATKSLLAAFQLPGWDVRYVKEPRAGKGYAYNTGLAAARGEVLLFTDDDVRVPREWIQGMAQPILEGSVDAVQGGVRFPGHISARLAALALCSPIHRSWFASTEILDPRKPERLIGANMAFGRRVLDKVPDFDLALGPGGLGFGDETLFGWRLQDEGFTLAGAFDVAVEHHFDESRISEETVRSIARRMGLSQGYLAWHWEQRNSAGAAWWLLLLSVRRATRKIIDLFWRPRGEASRDRELWYLQNMAFNEQLIRESRGPRRYAPRSLVKTGSSAK